MKATVVDGGPAALQALSDAARADQPFVLVLLDAMMPGMDGYEVAAHLADRPELSGPTVMMLSSADHRGGAARCERLGVAAHLMKPIRQSDLLDSIMTALGASVAHRARAGQEVDPGGLRPLRILLAEDNAVNQKLALRLLAQLSYQADVVEDGLQAIGALEDDTYDVVLMDVQMPELDGISATRRIRSQWPERPLWIVAMTANAMAGDREACLAAGMNDYISKPIRPAELAAALQAAPQRGANGENGASRRKKRKERSRARS
jgi:CheY-like chemotaxis protein